VRELLAAFLLFCVLLGILGITVLGFFLLGEGGARCFDLLAPSPVELERVSSKRTGSVAIFSNQKGERSEHGIW
jgi:hypothetical protein